MNSLLKGYITAVEEYFFQYDLNICVAKHILTSPSLQWKLKGFSFNKTVVKFTFLIFNLLYWSVSMYITLTTITGWVSCVLALFYYCLYVIITEFHF